MQELSEFQQKAAAAATMKMFNDKHFSICSLDSIASTIGRKSYCAGRDYDALRAVHCMDWADMGPDLARMVREKCLEVLGFPPQVIECFDAKAEPQEPAHEPSKRLRLAFWK